MTTSEQPPAFLPDWQAAELAAVDHMKSLGFIDAQRTQPGADGGIDIDSSEAAAQVKFYASPVGRPDIQRLRGAAHDYRASIFYSTGGYTNEATQYADHADVALFKMDLYGQAEPASQFAAVLVKSELIKERQERLDALRSVRYEFAAASLDEDVLLYSKFAQHIPFLSATREEEKLYIHITSALEQHVEEFKSALGYREFATADRAFEEINKRIGFLGWITGTGLRHSYKDLEEAISEGWKISAEADSEYRLHRIAIGAFDLQDLARESLRGWENALPDGMTPERLEDEELRRSAGMLLTASSDQSILSSELLSRLKDSVKEGVRRVHRTADHIYKALFDSHMNLDLPRPRSLVGGQVRVEALAMRICRQLDGS